MPPAVEDSVGALTLRVLNEPRGVAGIGVCMLGEEMPFHEICGTFYHIDANVRRRNFNANRFTSRGHIEAQQGRRFHRSQPLGLPDSQR